MYWFLKKKGQLKPLEQNSTWTYVYIIIRCNHYESKSEQQSLSTLKKIIKIINMWWRNKITPEQNEMKKLFCGQMNKTKQKSTEYTIITFCSGTLLLVWDPVLDLKFSRHLKLSKKEKLRAFWGFFCKFPQNTSTWTRLVILNQTDIDLL